MKAAFIEKFGGPEVLQYGDLPDPAAAAGEVVVDVKAASVNGADWRVRAGLYSSQVKFPLVLGRDFSGTVAAVGDGVTDIKIGDDVFGVLDAGHEGTYCEKIAIRAPSSPRSRPHSRMSMPPRWRSSASPRSSRSRTRSSSSAARRSSFKAAPAASRASPFSLRSISAPMSSPPRAPANIDYVRSLGPDRDHRLQCAGFHQGRERLRRGVRYRRRRGGAAILCRAQAGRPRRLHRLRDAGAEARRAPT